jgi:hypothetical protein
VVSKLKAGKYTFVVTDASKTQSFRLAGPGVRKSTSVKGTGRSTWTLTLKKGQYTYGNGRRTRTFKVV